MTRILVTVSICKGLRRICRSDQTDDTAVTCALLHILKEWHLDSGLPYKYGFRKWTSVNVTAVSSTRWLPHIPIRTTDGDIVYKMSKYMYTKILNPKKADSLQTEFLRKYPSLQIHCPEIH